MDPPRHVRILTVLDFLRHPHWSLFSETVLGQFLLYIPQYIFNWFRTSFLDWAERTYLRFLDYVESKIETPQVEMELAESLAAISFYPPDHICHIYKLYYDKSDDKENINPFSGSTFHFERYQRKFPVIWVCPFKDRLTRIFSHGKDILNFHEFLDVNAPFSKFCPPDRRFEIMFNMYDFDEDGLLSIEDLTELIKRLADNPRTQLEEEDAMELAEIILFEGAYELCDYMTVNEFILMMKDVEDIDVKFKMCSRLPSLRADIWL